MASHSFGHLFKITTFGESHGKAMGVVIDGCPAGLELKEKEINEALALRAPGRNDFVTRRKETDQAQILSGLFKNKTTGAPIAILIANKDCDSSAYESIKDILRPGHANFTYLEKFGIFDYRGGGPASARETACRVAAGFIAEKFLNHQGIHLLAFIKQIGKIKADIKETKFEKLNKNILLSPLFCPDSKATLKMCHLIKKTKDLGDSLGGIVEFMAEGVPIGLGSPIYHKLEAILGSAMMSIPASKGFEIGKGFDSVYALGSELNDLFVLNKDKIQTKTNHSGGVLAGISNGMPIVGRVVFKPTSSIAKTQKTLTLNKAPVKFKMDEGSRHDPCVAIRAVPVVKAMCALVLADALLLNRSSKL